MLDPADFGKAMAAIVNNATAPLLKRIEQLESRQLIKGDKGDRGEDAPAVSEEKVYAQVAGYLSEHPPAAGEKGERGEKGIDGKDAPPIDLHAVLRGLSESDDLLSLVDLRVKEQVSLAMPQKDGEKGERGEKGDQGIPGINGRDADPIDVRVVVRGLIESEDLLSLVELRVKEEVTRIPMPKDGQKGERGDKGEKGNDGAGVADLLIDRSGGLVATMTDGRMKSLGVVCGTNGNDGERGTDGKDGADFSGFDVDYDGERTLRIRGNGGEIVKRLPIPLDRGYWRAGSYEKGDIVTEGGTAYIAQKDTKDKPSLSSQDWRIFARKGRDGKDGRNGVDKTQPTKLKDGVDA